MIRPIQFPTLPYFSFTLRSSNELKESGNKCIKAVARITPVPKCFPIKNRTLGIRTIPVPLTAGNETAIMDTARIVTMTGTRRSGDSEATTAVDWRTLRALSTRPLSVLTMAGMRKGWRLWGRHFETSL